MATVTGKVLQVRTGVGRIMVAPFVAGGAYLPTTIGGALDVSFLEVGFTTDSQTHAISVTASPISVNERLNPIRFENTESSSTFAFTMAQINPTNIQLAMGGGTITTSGSTVTYDWPLNPGSARFSVVYESADGLERLILAKVYPTGGVTITRGKAPAIESLPLTLSVETSGLAYDQRMLFDSSLLA